MFTENFNVAYLFGIVVGRLRNRTLRQFLKRQNTLYLTHTSLQLGGCNSSEKEWGKGEVYIPLRIMVTSKQCRVEKKEVEEGHKDTFNGLCDLQQVGGDVDNQI